MTNKIKISLLAIIISLFFIQFEWMSALKLSVEFLTNLVTFLSIIFGFYVTSFSIFSTSSFVSDLYKIEDKNNKTQTLLHTLVKQYKTGLIINFISILYSLILIFLATQGDLGYLYLSDFSTYFVPILFIFNFLYGFKMLRSLIRVIMQESKIKK